MEMFGVLENAIDLKDLDVLKFDAIFKRMINNLPSIRKQQEIAYVAIQRKSMENKELLMGLLS